MISDRGTSFTSNSFKAFVEEYSIEHVLIATHTPRANGQIERCNRVITPMLAKVCESPDKWDQVLHKVEFAMNNTVHRSLGDTPSKVLFGMNQLGEVNDHLKIALDTFDEQTRDLAVIREGAAKNIEKMQHMNKLHYDKKRKPAHAYHIGDYVVIKNCDTTPGCNKKLIPKFRGPYEVKAILDKDRYVIADIDGFQLTQIPFQTVCSPDQMRLWCTQN